MGQGQYQLFLLAFVNARFCVPSERILRISDVCLSFSLTEHAIQWPSGDHAGRE